MRLGTNLVQVTLDLDLETLDLLKEKLAKYPGTVLLVSHDRDFLDRVAWVSRHRARVSRQRQA